MARRARTTGWMATLLLTLAGSLAAAPRGVCLIV
jgi:hypothetical protein